MKRSIFLITLALLLAACTPAATQPPAQAALAPTRTETTPTEVSTTEPTPTGAVAVVPATGGDDIRTYTFVPDQTSAWYEVNEVFFNENNRLNTAIGITRAVSGDILLNFTDPQKSTLGEITVDISLLKSDSSRRDNAIRGRWLESARFPLVKFVTHSVEGLPAEYEPGSEITFKVSGEMTVRDATVPVTFDVSAKLEGDTLSGSATTQILMTDFGFDPPDIAGILKADNDAKIVLTFAAVQK